MEAVMTINKVLILRNLQLIDQKKQHRIVYYGGSGTGEHRANITGDRTIEET